jgi:serine/threonine protein kinase
VIDGVPFLAMEFLEGETLTDYLKREGLMSPARMLEIMLPVFSAVAAVHARSIVHRDLKPDNIFLWKPVAGQLHPKLLDFGIAKVREGEGGMDLTKTGSIMGTPMYMSPEQWGGSKNATGASDQWALGVILFHGLTGRLPFEADEIPALMMRISVYPPPPLRSFAPTVPEALEFAVVRALAKPPEQRHASVRDFAKALLPFASPAARSRWSVEFGAEDPGLAHTAFEAQTGAPMSQIPPSPAQVPDTLNSSTKDISTSSRPARRSWGTLAVVSALGVLGVLGGVFIGVRLGGENVPVTTPVAPHAAAAEPISARPVHVATPGAEPARPAQLDASVASPQPVVASPREVPADTGPQQDLGRSDDRSSRRRRHHWRAGEPHGTGGAWNVGAPPTSSPTTPNI